MEDMIRFVLLLLLVSVPAYAQPGCKTVVLPELTNTPTEIATKITVPPGGQILYPFNYVTPPNGTTTGVETVFHRLVMVPITVYQNAFTLTGNYPTVSYQSALYVSTGTGWAQYVPDTVHVWYYQTLPHPPGLTDAESVPYLRTQYHSTKVEDFQNLSVVLQPPKNGLTGEGWNIGIANLNSFPVQVEAQAFLRECVTP